ncbi:dynein beta chain, ciliary-like isoform X2 [Temnothorax americanus]|uniref:dynein beta chain, ciliary-like isoform X2 n=1 Tax=Temnothorax americanus TaxID=1964332 RepID=UPI0040686155
MFETFRSKLDNYFKHSTELIPWNFDDELVLGRIMNFQKRLGEIKMLFDTAQEYFKLERMEFAILKKKTLCSKIYDIREKFVKIYNEFAELEYDILMPEEIRFTDHVNSFLVKVEEYDRELANIFDQVFSECHNTEIIFKAIWILGSMANRPIIMAQLWHNYERLLQIIHRHFDDIKVIFDSTFKDYKEDEWIETDQYFPHVAGALCTLTQLRQRIDYPMQCAKLIDHPLINLRIVRETKPKYDQMQSLMDAMEHKIFTDWANKVVDISNVHLSKSLLTIHENKLLDLNFDPELTALLRETRFMITMKRTDLTEEAIQLYYRTQYFFESTYNLSLLVQWYNWIRNNILPVDAELLKHEIEKVDEVIRIGQENYNWNSPEVPEYIDNLLGLVRKLHSRIFYAQENINTLLGIIYSWAMSPILERKDFKDENLLAVSERDEHFQKRYNQIEHASGELNRVLDENYKLFFDLLPDSVYEKDEIELDKNARIDTQKQEFEELEEITDDVKESQTLPSGLRIDEEKERIIARDGVENEVVGTKKNERMTTTTEITLTDEEIAQNMIKWKPYLVYVDNLISKALIQAASTRQ